MNMNKNMDNLKTFFQSREGISKEKVKYYIGWLNKFLEFHNGRMEDVSEGDLKAFGDHLENKGHEEWQVKQAQEAVFLYIEKFLNKKIEFNNIKMEGNVNRQDQQQPK